MQAMTKHWNRVILRLIGAHAPKVNGQDLPTLQQTDLTASTDAFNDIEYRQNGVDAHGSILIEQDAPFKTTIAALFGECDVEAFS